MPKRWVNAGERIPCSSKEPKPKFSECIRVRAIVAWIRSQSSKHLAKQRRFLQILFQSRAQIRVTPGQVETPLPPKNCQKSRKMNVAIKIRHNLVTKYRNPKLHSIASSIRNERNLLPYWSGSAVLKVKISRLRRGFRKSCKVRA